VTLPASRRPVPPAEPAAVPRPRGRLGRGRAGIVFAEVLPGGAEAAWKVFVPDRASRRVTALLTGAENPYRWSRRAVEAALLRRRVLERLVPFWFGDLLRLPRTLGVRRDMEHRAWSLGAERVHGRHARIDLVGGVQHEGEGAELVRDVLRPLQARLREAGFDGQLWQAGLGNPVAASNFLRETGPRARARWVWVDLESGVPALFPLNPWHLVRTYLPLGDKHGHWLFDDVDVPALRRYLLANQAALKGAWSEGAWEENARDLDALQERQLALAALRRHERSLASHVARGAIDAATARRYAGRPFAWLLRMAGRAVRRLPVRAWRLVRRLALRLAPGALVATTRRWARFFLSGATRVRWARGHVQWRLREARARGFLDTVDTDVVRAGLREERADVYLADFAVHLAIKPAMKLARWGLVPVLYISGAIASGAFAAFLVVWGGALGRTAYSLGRCLCCVRRKERVPWVALASGALPVVGNAAYPLQLLASGARRGGALARFLVRDVACAAGRAVPIWGGRDSLLEHHANAVASWLLRPFAPRSATRP
jgi:hypothetical protein